MFTVSIQKLCSYMVQMTIQLVAMNGNELITEKQGKLWNKAAVDYF